tara:strand:+ start:4572 stop:4793 length:222 start_codon:yes stop_codon:yes gene_type:complete
MPQSIVKIKFIHLANKINNYYLLYIFKNLLIKALYFFWFSSYDRKYDLILKIKILQFDFNYLILDSIIVSAID